MSNIVFQVTSMAEKWGSTLIARNEVYKFTGGLINPRTLANLDSQGKGPKGRIRVGHKVAYPVHEFVVWLGERIKPCE